MMGFEDFRESENIGWSTQRKGKKERNEKYKKKNNDRQNKRLYNSNQRKPI